VISEITALVLAYKYWAILPFALFEAPLMSIVIGFFAATGHLDLPLAFVIVAFGDFVGDTALYLFGRWCRPWLESFAPRLALSPAGMRKVLEYFERRDRHAIVVSKLVHGVGFTGLIAAGGLRVPYRRFILTCVAVSVSQSAVLVIIGTLSGRAYRSFAHWLGDFDIIVAVLFLLGLFVLYRVIVEKFSD
jgi:membrane protein DedA with SNARE-associated domain